MNRDPTLGRQPLELAAPAPPSEVARRLHELTHLPYEPWCEACVRGRGKDLPHYGLQRGELDEARLRPMVCMDWFDVASSGEDGKRVEGTTVTLLLTDAETGYVAAIPSPSKGQEMYTHLTKMVITFLKVMRHEKLKIRADQEPALKALIGMVKEQWPHRILVEESPLYSSQSNGRAERAIQTVRRLAASLRVATELRYEMALSSGMVAWPWLIRHAAWLHNRFHVKYNGRTCYEEFYQTRYKNEVVAFGECVLFMEPYPASRRKKQGKRRQKMDASMEPGIWLGRTEESDEHLVGTSRGVQRCRTVRRREESNQWDHRLFAEVKGVPWNLTLEAVARGRPKKVFVHFAAPLPEVVPQKDGTLRTFAETEAQTEKEKEDSEFSYPPTSPATTPQQEVESDGSEKEKSEAAGVVPPGSSQPVLPAAKKRTAEDSKEALSSSPTKKVALPVPTGTKRSPEIPAEALDPRAPSGDGGDEGEESEGGVLQVFTHVDEASPELPEESYIHLEEDVSLNTGLDDHP